MDAENNLKKKNYIIRFLFHLFLNTSNQFTSFNRHLNRKNSKRRKLSTDKIYFIIKS